MIAADATRLGEMFADDATVFYPSLPFPMYRLVGRSDIEAAWRAGFARIPDRGTAPAQQIQPKRVQIQTYGDTAIVTFELESRSSNAIPDAATVGTQMAHHSQTADAAAGVASEIEDEARAPELRDPSTDVAGDIHSQNARKHADSDQAGVLGHF
jgi:ketosteroid isomerase-like protein